MGKANVTIFHPEKDGRGSAVKFELHYQTDKSPGFIRVSFANQDGIGYDFAKGVDCDLDFDKVSKVIRVLEGDSEGLEEGNPITLTEGLMFAMKRIPERGFALAACSTTDGTERRFSIVIRPHEAAGLLCSLKQSMFFIAFIKGVNP